MVNRRILIIGDSKSIASNSWPDTLVSTLNGLGASPQYAADNIASAAQGAAYFAANISTLLATQTQNHTVVLINLGVNDFGGVIEAGWKADMQTTLDAIHAKWSHAQVYITKPWKQGFDSTADTFAGWITDLIATNSSFVAAGDDERSWLKPNVASYTIDGIHYSAAGQTAKAAQMAGLF